MFVAAASLSAPVSMHGTGSYRACSSLAVGYDKGLLHTSGLSWHLSAWAHSVSPRHRWCTVLLPVAKARLPLDHLPEYCLAPQEWRGESKDLEPSQPQLLYSLCAVPVSCGKAAACGWGHWAALCHRNVFGRITCSCLTAVTGSKTSHAHLLCCRTFTTGVPRDDIWEEQIA